MPRNDLKNALQSRMFSNDWDRLGLDDRDMQRLEAILRANPTIGDVVRGGAGIRKVRFAKEGRGKSGGFRVFYCYFPEFGFFYFARLLSKGESANIRPSEKPVIRALIDEVEAFLRESFQR